MGREELLRRALWAGGLLVGWLGWLAVGCALVVWLALRLADSHWIGTLLAFGPRWAMLMPVGLLAICAAFWRPKALVPLAIAGTIVAGPVMGLCLPVRTWVQGKSTGQSIRVLTCNTLVGEANVRLAALIEQEQPDVVALQECANPVPEVITENWNVVHAGGLVLASRWPIVASDTVASPMGWRRILGLRGKLQLENGIVEICVLHLTTPREGLEAVLARGWDGLSVLEAITARREVEAVVIGKWLEERDESTVLAGDFNMTPESAIYRREFGHLQNAFSIAGWGWGATKVTRYHGVRIDHILADGAWRVVRCKVGPDVGSDHRPVIADLEYVRSPVPMAPIVASPDGQ